MSGFDPQRIGVALRLIRVQREMEGREVAERAGITPSMLSAYEGGRQLPSLVTLNKILTALSSDFKTLHEALRIGKSSPSGEVATRKLVEGLVKIGLVDRDFLEGLLKQVD